MPSSSTACPYLTPVVADRLWLLPVCAYCRRPDGKIRVPGSGTITNVCATAAHATCAGYVAARTEEAFLSTVTG